MDEMESRWNENQDWLGAFVVAVVWWIDEERGLAEGCGEQNGFEIEEVGEEQHFSSSCDRSL